MGNRRAHSFPLASGRRLRWHELPTPLRAEIEGRLGSRVVEARSQSGGFSPGVAARLQLADGGRVFVKAVSADQNPDSPAIHRREARIAARLPATVPSPRLRWFIDDDTWVVLAFDDVEGRPPALPWEAADLSRVLALVAELAEVLTPAPVAAEPALTRLRPLFGGWERIGADAEARASLPEGVRDRLDDLVGLESGWPDAVAGDSLLHFDIRADNVLLARERAFVVDWPWASTGAPWLDLALLLPSVAMQGGPRPESLWRAHPLSAGLDDGRVDAFVAAFAGFLAHASTQPPAPGIPTLREFQAAQSDAALAWVAARRGWRDRFGTFRSGPGR